MPRPMVIALLTALVGVGGCGTGTPAGPPVEVLVVAPPTSIAGKDLTKPILDAEVEAIRKRREVMSVVPRMDLRGPALGVVNVDGHDVRFEVGGFTDGIPASAIEPELAERFVEPTGDEPVPVVISPTMIEIYNERFAQTHDLPRIGAMEEFLATRGGGLAFTIELGQSQANIHRDPPWPQRTVKARLVGVSRHAKPVGLTAPIGQVTAWNQALRSDTVSRYSSLVVTLRSANHRPAFAAWLEKELRLRIEEPIPW